MFTILRKNLQHTYEDIGKMFNLTHASVMHGVKEFPYMVTFNKDLGERYHDIFDEFFEGKLKHSNSELNLLQKKLKDLENKNEMLNLSFNNLKKSVENMVWAKDELKYTIEHVTMISNYKTWSDKKKIDTLLHIDCNQYCNLGVDATTKERAQVKQNSKIIYRTIRQINSTIGKLLLTSMD